MTLPHLLSALIFLPLVAGALLLLFGDDEQPGFSRGAALAVGVTNFLLSLPLLAGGDFQERMPWLESLGISYFLRVDGLSLWLILLATLATPLAVAASWKLVTERAKVYYGCMLLLSGGMIGVLCAMDLFPFYVYWEVMLIPAFFLVGAFGGARKAEATTKFVIYTMVGSLFMLVALVYTAFRYYQTTGTWSFALTDLYGLTYPAMGLEGAFMSSAGHWAFFAFLLAFGIKAALWPFHTWLPDAYGEAPSPVTFLLSAVMSKLGIYGLLRVALPLFPEAARDFAPLVITLAVIGVIYGALVALVQEDMKRLVAYASVSHLGVILVAVFTLSPQALSGAVLHMVAHALTTGALFLLIGFLFERMGTTAIAAYSGATKAIPVFAVVFMLVTLASVGLPGLTGFVGEFLIFLGAFAQWPVAASLAAVSIILGAAYMLWMFQRVMFGPLTSDAVKRLPDLSGREGLLFAPIVALIIAIGVYPNMLLDRINPAVGDYLRLAGVKVTSLELAQPAEAMPAVKTEKHQAPADEHGAPDAHGEETH